MRIRARLTSKRRALLAKWLETAMAKAHVPGTTCFEGMTEHESKEVKEVLDDLYTECIEGNASVATPQS